MPSCDYCDESFDDEDAYLEHLEREHVDELGPIDQRRVGVSDEGGNIPTGPLILGAILLLAMIIVGFVTFGVGGDDSDVGDVGTAHYHGTIEMTVLGTPVDFSQEQYQLRDDRFHFEGDGRWHAHATGVTLGYGMATLGINVTETSVTYNGTTYTDGEDHTVTVEVNGEPVTPADHVLEDGDEVRVSVQAAN